MRCFFASEDEALYATEATVGIYGLTSGQPKSTRRFQQMVQAGAFTKIRLFAITEAGYLHSISRRAYEPSTTITIPVTSLYTALIILSATPLQLGALTKSGKMYSINPQQERIETLNLGSNALTTGCVGTNGYWVVADDAGEVYVGKGNRLVKKWGKAGGPGGIRGFAVHAKEPLIAGAGVDGIIRVWEYPSGRLIKAFVGHRWDVQAVAFAQQGEILVSVGSDRQALIWRWQQSEVPDRNMPMPEVSAAPYLHRDAQGQVWLLTESAIHHLDMRAWKWKSLRLAPLKDKEREEGDRKTGG